MAVRQKCFLQLILASELSPRKHHEGSKEMRPHPANLEFT